MAEMLHLRPSTVSHHLQYLNHVGLVSAKAEGYYSVYRLEQGTLDKMAQRIMERETLPSIAAEVDLDAYDRKVIANFTDANGRVKNLPAQRKKLEVILRYVMRDFKPEMRYSEKQVNEILARYHPDTATLRRELVVNKMLMRDSGGAEYWLPEDN